MNLIHLKTFEILKVIAEGRIKTGGIYKVSKEANTNYAYASKVIKYFEKAKILTTERIGRAKIINITHKGEEIYKKLKNIYDKFEELKNDN